MTKCYEVNRKRETLTDNSKSVYNNENQINFECDHKLFKSVYIGDFICVDKSNIITKIIKRERYLMSELLEPSLKSSTIENNKKSNRYWKWGKSGEVIIVKNK